MFVKKNMQQGIHIVDKWTGSVPSDVYTSDAICITICRYWNNLNPSSGVYDWTDLDADIANIIANGKQFSIKVAAGDKTPAWVYALPVTKLTFSEFVGDDNVLVSIDQPVFWEANYITAWTTFVTALSAHLQVSPTVWASLSHVSITGINRKTDEYRICAQASEFRTPYPSSDAVTIWDAAGYTEALILSTQETFNTLFATQFTGKDLAFSMTNYGTTPPFPAVSGWTDMNQNAIDDLAVYGTRVYGIYTSVKSNFTSADVTTQAAAAGLSIAGQLSEKEFGDGTAPYADLNAAMQAAHAAGYKYMEMHDDSIISYNQYIAYYNLLFSQQNISTMSVTAKIILDKVATLIKLVDTTDYVSLGATSAEGFIVSLQFFDGVNTQTIYANPVSSGNADVFGLISPNNTIPITLPLNTDGTLKSGKYSFIYTVLYETDRVYTETFEAEYVFDYDFPTICLSNELKCSTSQLASRDVTDYGVYAYSISRTHTIYPPPASGKTPLVSSVPLLIYSNICTKTWTQEVVSVVDFVFESYFEVHIQLSGSDEIDVVCSTDICKVKCCMDKKFAAYQRLVLTNPAGAARMYELTIKPTEIALLGFLIANYCGNETDAATKLAELKEAVGCSGDCDDCGESPTSIIPTEAAGGMTFVVDSPDGSITVTSSTVGTEITYHVEVSAAIQAILDGIKEYNVVAGTGCTVVETAPGGVITFTVNVTPVTGQIRYLGQLKIYRNPVQPTPIGQAEYLYSLIFSEFGGGMQVPTIGLGQNVPNVLTDVIVIGISDFYDTLPSNVPFTAQANIMRYTDPALIANPTAVKDVEAEIYNFVDGYMSFTVRLYNPVDGTPLTFNDIVDKPDLYLQISIQA